MQIQVNTDSNVVGREELEARVATTVESGLARFGDRLTRVEVHLGDESAGRRTEGDKRCMIEARPAGRAPVAVTAHAASLEEALGVAVGKLVTVLGRERSRRDHHKGGPTIRTGGDDSALAPAPLAEVPPAVVLHAEGARDDPTS